MLLESDDADEHRYGGAYRCDRSAVLRKPLKRIIKRWPLAHDNREHRVHTSVADGGRNGHANAVCLVWR